ncbi:MAG: tetratricopeptide repeat protein [Betaproteobacteria bacterium]|nr:MAG: tetratricopeptide repeat protein [Betaproteobacteria bacterium]
MTRIYNLGPFRLDAETGVLSRAGVPAGLGSRAVAVLTVLVERPHEFVPKGSIIDAAWPGVVVEESNLPVQIAAIRRVLAQTPGGERWIETLIGRGYRFVGPVTEVADHGHAGPSNKPWNLPEALTSFIGRERELVEIKRLLPTKRLVTIIGIGGIGKTRLALQAGAEVVDAYRDGVWLAELASIRDPSLVPTTVAQALGVRERAGTPPIESLCAHLRSRQVLLILDNCEHLLDGCARLADTVLGEAKDATIMATSREALRVAGEQIYALQPLSLPERGSKPETMRHSEAVQLFVERVQRQLPGFELTPDRAPAVAEVCIHLDGIPLALELAAARARSLSVEQINARLGERFRLLTGGSRTALPRQQTLRATLDWSYDLLAEDERIALRRLAIFSGSFTVEAASAVASDATIDAFAVIDLLSQLVARSLVVADTSAVDTRYRLLETTRAYALEKLAEVGETESCKRRHAEYFRDLFDRAPEDWLRKPDAAWHATYVPELINVRAALDWALGHDGDCAIGTAIAGASGPLWSTLGLFGEGVQRLEAAVARIEPDTRESDQARLWLWLGRLVDEAPAQARPYLERAAELYRRLGDPLGLGLSLARLGRVLAFMGKFDQSEAVLTEARPLLERAGQPRALGFYFFNFAYLKSLSGDPVTARRYYEQSLALDRDAGDEFAVLATLGNLANVTWALGDLDAAAASFRQQIAVLRDSPVSTKRLLGYALSNLAGVLTERGDLSEALAAAREGLPLVREDGSAWIFVDHVALRAALAGKLSNAARLAGYADHSWTAKEATRHPIEARARASVHALLREKLVPDALERFFAEGAKMREDEACRLALEE